MTSTQKDIDEVRRTIALVEEQAPARLPRGLTARQRRECLREIREYLNEMRRHAVNMETYAAIDGQEATEAYEEEKARFARASNRLGGFIHYARQQIAYFGW